VDSSKVRLFYRTFDNNGTEKIRLAKKPSSVLLDGSVLKETNDGQGYQWCLLQGGGLLTIHRLNGKRILVLK
jgi:hypothetical protein